MYYVNDGLGYVLSSFDNFTDAWQFYVTTKNAWLLMYDGCILHQK